MESRRSRSTLRCLLLSAGLLAIGSPASLAASPAPSGATASSGPPTVIELLEPGAAPRQLLRYDLVAGTSGWLAMELDLTASTAIDGVEIADTVVPTIAMDASIDIEEVTADGTARYSFTFVDAGLVGDSALDPELLETIDAQLSQLIGLSGWAQVDSRGQTIDGDLTIPDGLDPTVQASLSQMQETLTEASAPFPEEPVGIGARWSVEQHLEDQGIEVAQTATYTLDAVEDDLVSLSVVVSQTAEPDTIITLEGMEPGTSVILRELTGNGDGTMTISLDDLVPTSDLTIAATTIFDVDGQALETQTVAGIRIRPDPPVDATDPAGDDADGTGEVSDS